MISKGCIDNAREISRDHRNRACKWRCWTWGTKQTKARGCPIGPGARKRLNTSLSEARATESAFPITTSSNISENVGGGGEQARPGCDSHPSVLMVLQCIMHETRGLRPDAMDSVAIVALMSMSVSRDYCTSRKSVFNAKLGYRHSSASCHAYNQ